MRAQRASIWRERSADLERRDSKPQAQPASPRIREPHLEGQDAPADLELLARVIEGESKAWRIFVPRYRALIMSCAMKVCRREGLRLTSDELTDVTAEVLLNLVANDCHRLRLYREDGGCSVSSWIGVIATSVARDYMRKLRRRPVSLVTDQELDQLFSPVPDAEEILLDKERRELVSNTCAQMSDRDRQFIDLYFVEAMSPEDIAVQMGISVSTVYSKKAKMKTRLAKTARRYG